VVADLGAAQHHEIGKYHRRTGCRDGGGDAVRRMAELGFSDFASSVGSRTRTAAPEPAGPETSFWNVPDEDPTCDWALAKNKIRQQIGQIPFLNWFEQTRQVERRGGHIAIAVPNETSRLFIETDYRNLIKAVLSEVGIAEIEVVIPTTEFNLFEPGAGRSPNEGAQETICREGTATRLR
jgi:hypothetical protein